MITRWNDKEHYADFHNPEYLQDASWEKLPFQDESGLFFLTAQDFQAFKYLDVSICEEMIHAYAR